MPPRRKTANRKPANEGRKHVVSLKTEGTKQALKDLYSLTEMLLPQFGEEVWNRHSLVSLNVSSLSRLLYLNNLYQQILDVPGVVCEFGVQWGATLAQLINLRSIYEPFNQSRMIYGFDTFSGFASIHDKDGNTRYRKGDLATLENYEETLAQLLAVQESFAPMSHVKKHALVKGDASDTISDWLEANPHAIISLAIFDMDLYEPTKNVLEKIVPRLTRGSVLAFDELNCPFFPGETQAVDEILGLRNLRLRRNALSPYSCWAVYGE